MITYTGTDAFLSYVTEISVHPVEWCDEPDLCYERRITVRTKDLGEFTLVMRAEKRGSLDVRKRKTVDWLMPKLYKQGR